MRSTCDICINESKNVFTCCACDYKMCRVCCRKWIKTDASCPRCHVHWQHSGLALIVGSTFYKRDYRRHLIDQLIIRELASLSEISCMAATERERRQLQQTISRLNKEHDLSIKHEEARKAILLRIELKQVRQQMRRLRLTSSKLSHSKTLCAWGGCSGIVVGGKCVRCCRMTCTSCEEPIILNECDTGAPPPAIHVCDPGVIKTIQLLRKDSKRCPSCNVISYKHDGCPTMWCPGCYTFWNWQTEKCIHRTFVPHNPDHILWLQQQQSRHHQQPPARHLLDIPCGGLPSLSEINEIIEFHPIIIPSDAGYARHVLNVLNYIQTTIRPRLQLPPLNTELRRRRVKFSLGDYASNFSYARSIMRLERTHAFNRDLSLVLETLIFVGVDLYRSFMQDQDLITLKTSLETIRTVTNEQIRLLSILHDRTQNLTKLWYFE